MVRQAPEELPVVYYLRALRLTLARINEHQVDIGGEIEFPRTQLAHAENNEWYLLTIVTPDDAVAWLERLFGTGAGVIFKGSGFYETDYKRAGQTPPTMCTSVTGLSRCSAIFAATCSGDMV